MRIAKKESLNPSTLRLPADLRKRVLEQGGIKLVRKIISAAAEPLFDADAPLVLYKVRLTDGQRLKLHRLGGAAWLRVKLAEHKSVKESRETKDQ